MRNSRRDVFLISSGEMNSPTMGHDDRSGRYTVAIRRSIWSICGWTIMV